MGKFFLGPLILKWCSNCNLPILLKNKCGKCGGDTLTVDITPPGDIRPAFDGDIKVIRETVDAQYGGGIGERLLPDDKIILLNKIGSMERSDEIILDGEVIGIIEFNPVSLKWQFIPRLEGARRLAAIKLKKYVVVDDGAVEHIIKGANVLAPGVIEYDEDIMKEEYVTILNRDRKVIGVGISKFNGCDYKSVDKGMVVKTKRGSPPVEEKILKGGQSWGDVLSANKKHLDNKVNTAKLIIKKAVSTYKKTPIVSFSGGKDSQCVLELVKEVLNDQFWVVFIDTGIEFPETIKHVERVIDLLGLKNKFIYKKTRGDFWAELEKFGPPARDFRYCCKILKLSAVTEAIEEFFKDEILNFTGQRRYESIPRSKERTIWVNPYVPNQINVAPIRDWTALHVWLYLYSRNIPLNPLYYKGYERIGCMFCPATKLSELNMMAKTHPEEYNKWINFLKKWASEYGLNGKWVSHGLWRWKNLGGKQRDLAVMLNIDLKNLSKRTGGKIKFNVTAGISPCKSGGYVVEGRFNTGLDLGKISLSLLSIGSPKYSENLGVLYLKNKDYTLTLFAEGSLKLNIARKELEKEILDKIIKLIVRAIMCSECGICFKICPKSAIKTQSGEIIIDKAKCEGCLKCLENCPAVNYTMPSIFE
ncbi:MAG: phosphoadenosine phosphosulfate reductase family protein [Candidatus Odinarchaeum yellowstonii]|uniref:Phosphoadenosine phosphosulfate reductase family protein n=1 Tax=Odinarchaeota yellowstonii (strain LCB_4) TaxID=1841599 RepID=A0AAF0D3H1_ODILC|nr:MAG: phosphoadenosine phosphosulfate reductase family protein [Candidatus Odinarchaeum yellowstonii]